MEEFTNRKTIRKYTEQEVSDDLLYQLLEAASHASTTGNMQLYSVIITRDKEKKAALAPTHFNQKPFIGAPVVLTFCADYNRFNKWCEQRKAVPGYNNFLSFTTAAIDTLLLAQNFAALAEHEGLGLCFLGTTTYNAPQIAKILNLPKYVVPVTTITLGYPAEDPELQDRIPVRGFVHSESYHDYDFEDIDRIFDHKESLEVNRQFVKENKKETLAQIFTDIRYTKKDGDHFSKIYFDYIKEQFEF
ncbi:MAG: nitroreductase family protein [Paludibacteraceae bacterium]|nr:nitroreductase family protein [Paludibacteraceae bacterium]